MFVSVKFACNEILQGFRVVFKAKLQFFRFLKLFCFGVECVETLLRRAYLGVTFQLKSAFVSI